MNTKPSAGHRKRLKQRYLDHGIESLQDYEMIELILTYAIPRIDVKPHAKRLIERFGSLDNVFDADLRQLKNVEGISDHSATLIKLFRDVGSEYLLARMTRRKSLGSPLEAVEFCRMKIGGLKHEVFLVIYLDPRHQLIDHEIISHGTVNFATVYPREIIKSVLDKSAASIILVHNHPSGDCQPSAHDLELTKSLKSAASTVGVGIIDHIIVGRDTHFSFVEEGVF